MEVALSILTVFLAVGCLFGLVVTDMKERNKIKNPVKKNVLNNLDAGEIKERR